MALSINFVHMYYHSRFQNSIQVWKNLSVERIVNALVVLFSFYLSRILQQPLHWGNPISLSVEPTTSCNLRCPECPSGLRAFSRPTGMLKLEFFIKLLDEIAPNTMAINFYFQGEPFLNKHLPEMIQEAVKKRIYTATSTNAHFLDSNTAKKTVESGLHSLIVSIDGTTQETYEQYRKEGNLEKVIEGTKNILHWKKELKSATPQVIFQFLVVRPNEHQTDDVLKLAAELGVDEVRFKTAQVYDFENGNPLIPHNEKYARYRQLKSGKWVIKNKLLNHCWRMWQGCVITWNGTVVPCCFDKDAKYQLGKFPDSSFNDIWKSPAYNQFRYAVLTNRQSIDICKNCTEGTSVFA
jgi:radical SAM protein with 4Fe4S-binding SPASM domain